MHRRSPSEPGICSPPPTPRRSLAAVPEVDEQLAFALELADLADAFTLPRYESADFQLGWKDDRSEVTEADRGAEALLLSINRCRPSSPPYWILISRLCGTWVRSSA